MKRAYSFSPRSLGGLNADGDVEEEAFREVATGDEPFLDNDSPSMFLTPPTSPSCETLPQTPTPKKRSPFRNLFDLEPKEWIEGGGAAGPTTGEFCEDSDGGAQPMSPTLQQHQLDASENLAPAFSGSFLSDLDEQANGMPAPLPQQPHQLHQPQLQQQEHLHQNQVPLLPAPPASVAKKINESVLLPGAQKNAALDMSMKSPRVRGLNFGNGGMGEDLLEMNLSNIAARKVPNLNLSMPAAMRGGGGGGGGGGAKSPSRQRSPRLNQHSTSMLVTHPGPGLGDEEASSSFLKTRQPIVRTPRGVAMNPFQSSPKSTMGSAKKKSRTLGNSQSRYMQDFEERQKIGTGHFSEVYECSHRMDGMTYAVKVLKEELSAPRLNKVMSEVFALAALPAHDNLIRYYSCWTETNRLYIQTELCEAGNLESKLNGMHRYTEEQLLDVLRQVLAGLAHIHKGGLCHLDIKPENILVTFVKNGVAREPVYKIGDLGLVMKSDLTHNFHQDVEGGDGRYMSPELMEGMPEKLIGNLEKSDIWSLGCTVYALARRRDLPSGGDEYAEIRCGRLRLPENEYSPAFLDLLRKMINPDVQQRLSATQLLRQPLLRTRDARRYHESKLKKRRLKGSVAAKEKELILLQTELQLSREREAALTRELQREREAAANERNMDQRLTEMYTLMQKSLSIEKHQKE